MPDSSSTPLCSKTCSGAVIPAAVIAATSRLSLLPAASVRGFPVGVAVSIASRIRGEGGISGMGGCKIGSLRGLVQAGNAGPRSP